MASHILAANELIIWPYIFISNYLLALGNFRYSYCNISTELLLLFWLTNKLDMINHMYIIWTVLCRLGILYRVFLIDLSRSIGLCICTIWLSNGLLRPLNVIIYETQFIGRPIWRSIIFKASTPMTLHSFLKNYYSKANFTYRIYILEYQFKKKTNKFHKELLFHDFKLSVQNFI